MKRPKPTKGTNEINNQSENSSKSSSGEMHYASASRARARDRSARRYGGRRGIFGVCLSGRGIAVLLLVGLGFAMYCFAVSNGYLKAIDEERSNTGGVEDVQKEQDTENMNIGNQQNENGVENNLDMVMEKDGSSASYMDYENEQNDKKPLDDSSQPFKYHILQTLTNTHKMPHLKTRFEVCMKSILDKCSVDLLFIFVVDGPSRTYLESALQDITDQEISTCKFQFFFLDIDELAKELTPLVNMMQSKIQGNHPYYKDSIFFLSTMLHKGLLPDYVHQVVMLDTDLKFMTDIKELFDHFDHFQGDNIMGVVHEQQPVYRHIFSYYRSLNRGTRVGDPPPYGLTGFNSGVLLLDLDRIRSSEHFEHYLKPDVVTTLRDKFHFKGHLGDQDFYTLISMEKEDLFYNLPCSWNKQLCIWWKDKGYATVWDQYFECKEKINIYHGNCNTKIPY